MIRMRWVVLGLFTLNARLESPPPSQPWWATPGPSLVLEKTRFAVGERIVFQVGVTSGIRIPRSVEPIGRLTITRPDGTRQVDTVRQPIDGCCVDFGQSPFTMPTEEPRGGWLGQHSLRDERPRPGRYVIKFEFADFRAVAASFVVEDIPLLKTITGEFTYPSPLALDAPDAFVTFTMRNGSTETIRFRHRGDYNELVSVGLRKTTGQPWIGSFFVPDSALRRASGSPRPRIGAETFTWKLVGLVPTVTLTPGQSYSIRLPLSSVFAGLLGRLPSGEYDLVMSTTVQILVGERNGPFADLAPLRLPVVTRAHGVQRS